MEVQWVREVLEGAMAPQMATAVLFEALERSGVPEELDVLLAMVRGPLSELLDARLGPAHREAIVETIERRLGAGELELDVELADELEDESRTAQMDAVPHPVAVLVASADEAFAGRLLACLGDDRVYPHTVGDEAAFRHAAFSMSPLVAVIDAANPAAVPVAVLAAAVRALPDRTLPVVWDAGSDYARQLRAKLEGSERTTLFLDRSEGVEPLLDLVLCRFKSASSTPPPA